MNDAPDEIDDFVSMAAFSEEMKRFAVRALAEDNRPSEVAAMLKERFGLDQAPPTGQIARYDPDNVNGEPLRDELKRLFFETRHRFRTERADIPILNPNWRARELLKLFYKNLDRGATMAAAQIMEQAAKDDGGMYRQRPATGTGASPDEVAAAVAAEVGKLARDVRAAVDRHVTDPHERERIEAAIQEGLEGGGP